MIVCGGLKVRRSAAEMTGLIKLFLGSVAGARIVVARVFRSVPGCRFPLRFLLDRIFYQLNHKHYALNF